MRVINEMKIWVYIIISIILIMVILFLFYKKISDDKKIIEQLNKEYGEKPRSYKNNKMPNIKFLKKCYEIMKSNKENGEFQEIDELTWNDLDMDSVFKRINYNSFVLIYYFIKARRLI